MRICSAMRTGSQIHATKFETVISSVKSGHVMVRISSLRAQLIETSAALTSLDCKAKCRLNGKCNAINFNAKASICEPAFCNHGEMP